MSTLLGFLLPLWLLPAGMAPVPGGPVAEEPLGCRPVLTLSTRLGAIEIELLEPADPEGVRKLVRLVRGPTFHPELGVEEGRPVGFYEGLAFDYTRPHVELATETRKPADLFTFATRIDAEALGLDRRLVQDAPEAMAVLQEELLPEFVSKKKRGTITPQLAEWLEEWYARQEPGFLVGVSRQRINEALGYTYERGLASPPPTRGAVALWPESRTRASARLTIFLADLPQRAGRWMVVGRVIEGLDVAATIASQPLDPSAGIRAFEPIEPIAIDRTHFDCAPAPDSPGTPPKEEDHATP